MGHSLLPRNGVGCWPHVSLSEALEEEFTPPVLGVPCCVLGLLGMWAVWLGQLRCVEACDGVESLRDWGGGWVTWSLGGV